MIDAERLEGVARHRIADEVLERRAVRLGRFSIELQQREQRGNDGLRSPTTGGEQPHQRLQVKVRGRLSPELAWIEPVAIGPAARASAGCGQGRRRRSNRG